MHSLSVEASTDHPRCPICDTKHGYTGSNRPMKLLTRLADCETGNRYKTKEERRTLSYGTKDVSIEQAGSTKQTHVRRETSQI